MSSKIKILNSSLAELATLNAVGSASRHEKINAENTLSFSFPIKKAESAFIESGTIYALDGDYFDTAYYKKEQQSGGKLIVSVECEHVSYRLNGADYNMEYFTEIGEPSYILGKILAGTGFTAGVIEFSGATTFSIQEAASRRGVLMQFVAYLGGEVEFDGFTVSILQHRGSATPKALTVGKDITVISKSVDSRTTEPTIVYACGVYKGATLALGDVVTLDYEALDIDVSLRVVSKTHDPYNPDNVAVEIGNYVNSLEDDLYRIETQSVKKDALMNGCRIGPEYGFEAVRNDKLARAYFKSDGMAMQAGDGSGSSWIDKIYFDPVKGTYIFDGELSADIINALSVLISPNLYAGKATIAEVTVDQLDTSDKVQLYLDGSDADDNYQKIYDQFHEFITAQTDGLEANKVQAADRNGNPLYWTDETHTAASETETSYPVYVYAYTETNKMRLGFKEDPSLETEYYVPVIELGAGTGTGDNGKGFIYKGADGLYVDYHHSTTGKSAIIKITDDGIDFSMFPTIVYNEETVLTGMPQVWVQDSEPSSAKTKDLWIDTDDYTRYDATALTADTTLSVSDNEVITCSGTFTVTLHEGTVAGIIKKLYNIGTGIITVSGTINGATNMYLYPGESVELVTDGTNWRC